MKICIASQTFAPQEEGGAEISSRHAAVNLSKRHDVVVLALGMAGIQGVEPGECVTDGTYRLFRVPFHNAYLPEAKRPAVGLLTKALWHAKSGWGAVDPADINSFLSREKFDLIYAQNSSRLQPALYRVAFDLDIPVCQHLRDYALLCSKTSMYRRGQNCAQPCHGCTLLSGRARRATDSVRTVIAVSDFVLQRFHDHGLFATADCHVLHNTNTARTDFDQTLLASRGDPEPGFTFGYLGSLSAEKGVEVMLDAFCALPKNLPVRLLLAGRGHSDFIAAMRAKTNELAPGRIEWLGFVEPEAVYARAEVILLPSLWHEPQSRVLIEAATYGIPVFAARTGGSAEIVDGHRTGSCYEATDRQALKVMMQDAATGGAATWRNRLADLFPGLENFKGTAEDTDFYMRLEQILVVASHTSARKVKSCL